MDLHMTKSRLTKNEQLKIKKLLMAKSKEIKDCYSNNNFKKRVKETIEQDLRKQVEEKIKQNLKKELKFFTGTIEIKS